MTYARFVKISQHEKLEDDWVKQGRRIIKEHIIKNKLEARTFFEKLG